MTHKVAVDGLLLLGLKATKRIECLISFFIDGMMFISRIAIDQLVTFNFSLYFSPYIHLLSFPFFLVSGCAAHSRFTAHN